VDRSANSTISSEAVMAIAAVVIGRMLTEGGRFDLIEYLKTL
jgi:ribose/xylose/arabinose/galactoside ABC-type transport system permease subunit